jgi:hypothetical protein
MDSRSYPRLMRVARGFAFEQEVCGSWAGRKGLMAVCSGEWVVGADRVVLGQ